MRNTNGKQTCKAERCNRTMIPYKEFNEYCYIHIPDDRRCTSLTRDGKRCRQPALPGGTKCKQHIMNRKNRTNKRKKASKYKAGRNPGYVYLIDLGRENFYKIGQSTDTEKRLAALRAANPWASIEYTGVVFNAAFVEGELHHMFGPKRVEREIFYLTPEDIEKAKAFIDEHTYHKQEATWQ